MKIVGQNSEFLIETISKIKNDFSEVEICDMANNPEIKNNKNTVFVGRDLTSDLIVAELIKRKAKHIVQFNEKYFDEDLITTAQMVQSPKKYFDENAKAILPIANKEIEITFYEPNDKENLRNTCLTFAQEAAKHSNVVESTEAIIEEMYMNAIFDAPRLAQKNNSHNLEKNAREIKIIMRLSHNRMAISCVDKYGSLDQMKFINRLDEIYKNGAGNVIYMNRQTGAGIGCSLMMEHCSSLYLGVIPNKLTVVTCVIPVGLNNRERGKVNRSLHLINL